MAGQCKGIFFTSFCTKNSFRRCGKVAKSNQHICELCKRMRDKARKSGLDFVSCEGHPEYNIVQKALFTRPGVMACRTFWKTEAKEIKKKHKM